MPALSNKHRPPHLRTPEIRAAASGLAQLLADARNYLAATRPRICADCHYCYVVASIYDPRRCWSCGEPPS